MDRIVLNVNTMGLGPYEKVCDWMDGFVVADLSFYSDGKKYVSEHAGRIAVFYRDQEELKKYRIIMKDRPWIYWPDDMEKLYREGKVRYLVTSAFDYQWFGSYHIKADPVFYCRSPFTCKARVYDMSHAIPNMSVFYNDPYFRRIGIYDLKDIFGKKE